MNDLSYRLSVRKHHLSFGWDAAITISRGGRPITAHLMPFAFWQSAVDYLPTLWRIYAEGQRVTREAR